MKRYLILLLSLLLVNISAFGTAVSADNSITVRVGVYANSPKIFTDTAGKVSGFWPDILEHIASQEGWDIVWVPGTWAECLQRLQNGDIDIMPDVAYTDERNQIYAFATEPVYTSWSIVYTREDTHIQSIPDLEGKLVAVSKGSVNVEGQGGIKQLVQSFNINCTFKETDTYDSVFTMVKNGEADAGITSKDFGFLHENDYRLIETPIIFQPSLLYFAFPKNATLTPSLIRSIDSRVKELKSNRDSIYYNSLNKWFAQIPSGKSAIPQWVIWMLAGIGGLVLLSGAVVLILRSQVKSRTKELTKEIAMRKQADEAIRQSEAKYATLVQQSNDGIIIVQNGLMVFVNRKMTELASYSFEEVVGKPFVDFLTPQYKPMVADTYRRRMQGEAVPNRYDAEIATKTGTVVPIEINSGIIEYEGKPATMAVVRDMTERKRADKELAMYREHLEELVKTRTAELEQANIHLQEMDRLKSVFLASMSHELRTPLNSIIGFTGILLMGMSGELEDEQKKQLGIVKNNASHLLSLINDILDISKIEAGRIDLNLDEFNFKDIVKEVVEPLLPVAGGKGLEITTEIPEHIILFSDKRRIKQVLVNFVNNAIKFTDRGSVRITASITGDGKLEVRVTDTGVGIKQEEMGKLFQPFQQVGASLTKKYEGTGLGLYLSGKLIKLLGGSVSVKSEYGHGSEFTSIVPLRYKEENPK